MTSTQQMFNPSLEKYETLKEMMTEREDELESILGRLKSTQVKGTSRSFVVIGQRGMGKTHFLMLLYHEIKKRKNLKNKYVSLKFSEEEYSIDSLAYFFIRILEELKNECNSQEEKERIKEFLDLSVSLDDKELVKQSKGFLEVLFQENKKKIVLCVDNIDIIFENISYFEKTGLKHLRSILQSKDYMLIIGSAPTFFKEIQNHDEPFYSYFEIIRLSPLSAEGVEELFMKLAEIENNTQIIEEFDTLKPRIKTIIHFTSGVPRLVRMLYYVISNAEITEVADSLEKLLDELTPYYQARMARLSPQQQKIIDTIALLEGPSTPTQIAKAGRMERPTVNAQLKKLVDTGFVHLVLQKRRKWRRYDITERMFRIWREMRRETSRNRVKYLADFLKAFYTPDEFEQHRKSIDEKFSHSIHIGKDSDALKYVKEYEFIKEIIPHEMLPDFEFSLIEKYILVDELKKPEDELDFIKDLKTKRKMPKEFDENLFKLEMKKIEKVLEKKPEDVSNRLKKGWLLFQKNKYKEAIKEFDKVLKINPKNEDAQYFKGLAMFDLKKYEEAIKEFDKALKINPKNENALLLKGKSFGSLEKYQEALLELDKALKINPKNEDALTALGSYYLLENNHESFFTWFDNIETSKRQFDSIFKSWRFCYEFERKNAIKFLKDTVSFKDCSEEFPKFWDDLLRFTIHEILHFSAEDFKVKNFGSASEKLSLLFESKELWKGEDVYNFFLEYFKELLKTDISHAEEVFNLFKEKLGENFKGTFRTLDKTIAFLKSRDVELLEKLYPEEREVVEELVEQIEGKENEV